jgi:hypothetical protein
MKIFSDQVRGPTFDLLIPTREFAVGNARIINACILLEVTYGHAIKNLRDLIIVRSLYPENFYEFFGPQSRLEITNYCKKLKIPIKHNCKISDTWIKLFVFKTINYN